MLDPEAAAFRVTDSDLRLPAATSSVAWNASNEGHWSPGLRSYLRNLRAGAERPRGRDFNMRWLAATVGELHRILKRGGLFLYPPDARPGYGSRRLPLAYEAVPIAFLVEQAGGVPMDGAGPILDRAPKALHEHVPLIFGARDEVEALSSSVTPA